MADNELKVRFTGDTSGLKKSTKKAQSQINGFNNSVGKLGSRLALAFSVGAIINFTRESVKLAATLEGVSRRFDQLNGVDLSELQKATRGTVDNLSLMKAAVQAKNFKVPLESLSTLFEFATQRAVDTGESVQKLTGDIVLGLGRKSIRILDNLGISAVELRKKMGGVGTEMATVKDTTDALLEIIEESSREVGGFGEGALTTGQKLQQMNTSVQDLKQSLGEVVADSDILTFLGKLTKLLSIGVKNTDKLRESTFLSGLTDAGRRAVKGFKEEMAAQKKLQGSTFDLNREKKIYLDGLRAIRERKDNETDRADQVQVEKEIKGVQARIDAIKGYVAQKIEEEKAASDINTLNEDQSKTLDKLNLALNKVSASVGIQGTDYTRTQERIKLYQGALINLIANGLDPASEKAKELTKQLRIQEGLLKEAPEPLTGAPGAPASVMSGTLPTFEGGSTPFDAMVDGMTDAEHKAYQLRETMKGLGESVGFTFENIATEFSSLFAGMLQEGNLTFKGLLIGLGQLIAKLLIAVGVSAALRLLLTGDGKGVSTAVANASKIAGGLASSLASGIPFVAEGGITNGATLAMVGEGKEQEAILPLSKLASLMGGFGVNSRQSFRGGSGQSGLGGAGSSNVTFRIQGNDLVGAITRTFKNNGSSGGSLSFG
tara:strand:+ start:2147 stop:4129 length:1983 start_codon:yes stop_codon:yes gene_type:complete